MRRIIAVTAAAALAVGLAACATDDSQPHYSLVPIRANGQDLPGMDSRTTVESRQPGGIVSIRAANQFANFGAAFIVAVQNKSSNTLEFGPLDIAASVKGEQLTVLAADELDAALQSQLRGYLRATSRIGAQDFDNASASANRDYRFNNYGGCPAGQAGCQIYSDGNGSEYRQDRINRELQADTIANAAATLQANKTLIEQKALRKSSVGPGEIAGGVIVVRLPPADNGVDLTIMFNGQKHNITFAAVATPQD